MTELLARAPAKVNLSLHVGPAKPSGRHELVSIVTFADALTADVLVAEPTGTLSLAVDGPFAQQAGPAKDNLVLQAARRMNDALDGKAPTLGFRLTKNLPAAAGIGGGSADAAAALRLIAKAAGDPSAMQAAERVAPELGGDVLACLFCRPGLMKGEGEIFDPLENLPPLPALLVNPGVTCPTGPVFRAYDESPVASLEHPSAPLKRPSTKAFIRYLRNQTRNDLGAPAARLVPEISDTLRKLQKVSGARLVRMSGSGATCFALFETLKAAEKAADQFAKRHPENWIAVTQLGGGGLQVADSD